jgi:hypothetical protein
MQLAHDSVSVWQIDATAYQCSTVRNQLVVHLLRGLEHSCPKRWFFFCWLSKVFRNSGELGAEVAVRS